jgi:hypothetical protein
MNTIPELTLDESHAYLDFVGWRLLGWSVVDRMGHHGNSKAAKLADERFREIIGAQPKYGDFVAAAMAGTPVWMRWPAGMQDEVERRINTKVPRAVNEPTSPEFAASMRESQHGHWELPDFLKDHGRELA